MFGSKTWAGKIVVHFLALALMLASFCVTAAVQESDASTLRVTYSSENFCDVHYKLNGGGQLNYPMSRLSDGSYEYKISGLKAGDVVSYSITYQKNGLAYDTPWANYTFAATGGGNSSSGSSSSSSSSGGRSPFTGSAMTVPGIVEAEHYDKGGEGIGYHDTSTGNSGGLYRTDNVDIEASTGGGYDVGWMASGEWLEYSVNVQNAGSYDISARVASQAAAGRFHFEIRGATSLVTPSQSFSATGGWQNWAETASMRVSLNAGSHIIRFVSEANDFNLDRFSLSSVSSNLPMAYSGYTGNYPDFTLAIDDRFDALDTNLWEAGDGGFSENDCRFQSKGVSIANGVMSLRVTKESVPASWSFANNSWIDAKNYACGELRSRNTYLYGRFEARIRNPDTANASGYISSLFTYANNAADNYKWREIDVEMEGGRPTMFQSNLIYGEGTWEWWRTRDWGAYEVKHEIGATSEWRVHAIEWTSAYIKWFVDGQLIRTLTSDDVDGNPLVPPQIKAAQIPDIAQKIMMNFWIPNDTVQDNFGGNKSRNIYPMSADYDWFRYYRWTPGTR